MNREDRTKKEVSTIAVTAAIIIVACIVAIIVALTIALVRWILHL